MKSRNSMITAPTLRRNLRFHAGYGLLLGLDPTYACFPLVLGDELAVFVVVEAGKGDIGKGRLEVISDDLDV